ncbi:MAG: hypothetical protein M0Z79_07665 [Nitrospiraceae bacterium]|nr:hypothetical protein [Nitrospiraceae bacterium]
MVSVAGKVSARGVVRLSEQSIKEYPDLTGRITVDARRSDWRFRAWLEGGWDGTVLKPRRDHALFKNYHDVYQDNTPYLEFKELYAERSFNNIDLRIGIQRFSWGRLDEYPLNDLFNPWDYTRFIVRSLEDRKVGVPSVSATLSRSGWTYQAVWVPVFVPYRLPKSNERWAVIPADPNLSKISGAEVIQREPALPPKKLENSSVGIRAQRLGEIEWAFNLFHGFDPRPIFKSTALNVEQRRDKTFIDPGFVPSFHKITSIGFDAAAVKGDWSLRAEAAYALNRPFNVRPELWGYPKSIEVGATPLNPAEIRRDTLDYGIAADYRLFEDGMLTLQAQQTVIFNRPAALYDRTIETILWANMKAGWMNRKIETNLTVAYNPEHGAGMARANAYYTFTDSWKAGVNILLLDGPPQSLFGRYSKNDRVEMEVVYSW